MLSKHKGVSVNLILYLPAAPRFNLKCIEEMIAFVFVVSESRIFVYYF